MTLDEILTADIRAIGPMLGRGFAWWMDELRALVPERLREAIASKPKLLAQRSAAGEWRYWRVGAPNAALPEPRPGTRVCVVLSGAEVLVRELRLPALNKRDLRRVLTLDLDRLSPLRSDLVCFDVESGPAEADGRARVLLGLVARTEAAAALAAARREGLEPAALSLAPSGAGGPRFDFLPAIKAEGGRRDPRRLWWGVAAGLAILNLAAFIGRDIVDTDRMRALVEARAPQAAAVERVRSRVLAEESRRSALMARRSAAEPLAMLDEVTLAAPPQSWVQHLEWNGRILRIVGFAAPDLDMSAAIRGAHVFVNPRSLSTGPAPKLANGQPFDITADARRGA
ncbi:MAG TPA: hypothetical protein VGS12_13350 [Caulobacteraceae bacterium]|nr:hypothetical protein [Caulobacteraceae bacterium]